MRLNLSKINFIFFIIFFAKLIEPVSYVYNLKIAETTRRTKSLQTNGNEHPTVATLLLVNQYRKRYNGVKESASGGLASINYSPKNYYFRADFAVANVKQKIPGISDTFSKIETDDILLSAGFTKKFNDKARMSCSGLLGIPTHKDLILQGIEFGTGHFGIGSQIDGSFIYSENKKNTIFAAARFIYFFPATLNLKLNNNDVKLNFELGNLVDLFISHQNSWGKNKLEFGYNASFGFNSNVSPNIDNINSILGLKFIRSSFFGTYIRGFFVRKHLAGVVLGLSYGFDHIPKTIGLKSLISFWLGAGINF